MNRKRVLRAVAVALGLLLVFSPFWLGALHAGEERTVYRAVSVGPDGEDGLTYATNDSRALRAGEIAVADHVLCVGEPYDPGCALAGTLVGNGTVRTHLHHDDLEQGFHFYHNGSLYEITIDRPSGVDPGERGAVYDAEPRSGADLLAAVTRVDPSLTDAERRAIETGTATAYDEPRGVPRFVDYEGSYYLLYTGQPRGGPLSDDWFDGVGPFLGTLAGVGLVAWGAGARNGGSPARLP